ncbi:GNAT family N-acetyltransferase [Butyrivibrio sp. INlla16]|uniref:GNAT family N-acetyltransferase n=1 Tax=Butyrivibrio sp. INlla16 TaxID=1520807 RepID=UPI00088E6500|nr:GNAT family N-acetyltransferase [Butyrivibrio sp. INlla16]SDB61928.1 Acetyltransferase (GNAT) family protein [Butyrivibrio sp. INlla16]
MDKELADLDTYYKDGALLIGFENANPIATIAIKRIDKDTCEAKRLYIKPDYRGKGYARVLMNEMLHRSRKLGFKEVTFTTKPEVMSIGYGLYKRMSYTGYYSFDKLPARCANSYIYCSDTDDYRTNIYSVGAKGTGDGVSAISEYNPNNGMITVLLSNYGDNVWARMRKIREEMY